ncbi:MAG: hypothetical protein VX916_06285, partial [Planctomycetota bacterium]|nr:hypothetical protein [Planctomycetota bacterium]
QEGAEALLFSGNGGSGGDVLLLKQDGTIAFNLKKPDQVGTSTEFEDGDPKLNGVTGRSSTLPSAVKLEDLDTNLQILNSDPVLSAAVTAGEILLQPNAGVGANDQGANSNAGTANQEIDENHAIFTVKSLVASAAGTTLEVTSGDLQMVSENQGTLAIANAGDSYLVGRFRGSPGTDGAPFGRQGTGAEPYLVVNAAAIDTKGGGGGGGGAVAVGVVGENDGPASDPGTDQRASSFGISLNESPGAAGGIQTIVGDFTVTSTASGIDRLVLFSQLTGTLLSGLAGADLVGAQVVVRSDSDGWLFDIGAFDGTDTIDVDHIVVDTLDIDLNSGAPGGSVDGPGLSDSEVIQCTILPHPGMGGAGGGGTGVSVTGTVKAGFTDRPELIPGAGGGSGGGVLEIESAGNVELGPAAQILAGGGVGGSVTKPPAVRVAGGGGGGGGRLTLRYGDDLQVFTGAVISADGGAGGGFADPAPNEATPNGRGGKGGGGYIRIETLDDSVDVSGLAAFTEPAVTASDVGRMFGLPQGVGQSIFFDTQILNPHFDGIAVNYKADIGSGEESFAWVFGEDGVVGDPTLPPPAGTFDNPPFKIECNSIELNDVGFLDSASVNTRFLEPADLISARTGLVYDGSVLLYCTGRDTTQIHRLDPVTLLPDGTTPTLDLPTIPSVGDDELDVVSMAVDGLELFLLERLTGKIHVFDLTVSPITFLRTITLPPAQIYNGAMSAISGDQLALADNVNNRLAVIPQLDPISSTVTTDFSASIVALHRVIVTSTDPFLDGLVYDMHVTGMAYDVDNDLLWCVDATAGLLYEVTLVAGFEGQCTAASQRLARLQVSAAPYQGFIPSAVAFDKDAAGEKLFLIHAVDPAALRVFKVEETDVPMAHGGLTVVPTGGVAPPESARAFHDGNQFLRFKISIDGLHDEFSTNFRQVRIDDVTLSMKNQAF